MNNTPSVNIDLIIVCRKQEVVARQQAAGCALADCLPEAQTAARALQQAGINLSQGDIRMILMGCCLSRLTHLGNIEQEQELLRAAMQEVDGWVGQVQTRLPG